MRTGTNWAEYAAFRASNTQTMDFFGFSVALSGGTAVVGGWGEDSAAVGVNGDQNDNSATNSGAAYVFSGLPMRPPNLVIERINGNVRVAWPRPASGFLLQHTPSLSGASSWMPVASPYETNSTHISTIVPPFDDARFYWLHKP